MAGGGPSSQSQPQAVTLVGGIPGLRADLEAAFSAVMFVAVDRLTMKLKEMLDAMPGKFLQAMSVEKHLIDPAVNWGMSKLWGKTDPMGALTNPTAASSASNTLVNQAASGAASQGAGGAAAAEGGAAAAAGGAGGIGLMGALGIAAAGVGVGVIGTMAISSMVNKASDVGIEKATLPYRKAAELAAGGETFGPAGSIAAGLPGKEDVPGVLSMASLGLVDAAVGTFKGIIDTGAKVADSFTTLIVRGIDPATEFIQKWTNMFDRQVAAYNPGIVERFHFQLDNLTAAAGKMFQPIITSAEKFAIDLNILYTRIGEPVQGFVQVLAEAGRSFATEFAVGFTAPLGGLADAAKNLLTELQPVITTVGRFGGELFNTFGETLTMVTHDLSTFHDSIQFVTSAVQVLAAAVFANAASIRAIYGELRQGHLINAFNPERVGADWMTAYQAALERFNAPAAQIQGNQTFAAQPARQIGIEEIGQQARAAAFSLGPSSLTEIAAEQLARQQEMVELLRNLERALAMGNADDIARAQADVQRQAEVMGRRAPPFAGGPG
jgi:hypothetical protein